MKTNSLKFSTLLIFSTIFGMNLAIGQSSQSYQSPAEKVNMNKFVSALMVRMTLDEKIGQLNLLAIGFDVTGPLVSKDVEIKIKSGLVGGVLNTITPEAIRKLQDMAVKETRLKIPLLFGYDVIHGYKTIFPIPLALSCAWDMELVEKSARIAAQEASADGLNWTFSPMVDIARDPRWGRVSEGAGEDAWLGSQIAKAMVKGYQGDDLSKNNTILACVKHFALYGAAEAGREYNTVDMSVQKMYEYYLPPYRAAIDAGAGSAMSSFNEINGVPATGNKWLLTDLLRKQWGFTGFVVSDYTAVSEMTDHGIGKDLKDVSAMSLNAGVDMDMVSEGFVLYAKELVKEGKVKQKTIDDACRYILEAKYKLGLFDDPYRYISEERAKTEMLTPENRKEAMKIAEQAIVLLKNDKQLLPLKKSGTIALIGPRCSGSDWAASIGVKEGINNSAGGSVKVLFAKGCNLLTDRGFLKQISGDAAVDSRSDDEMISEAVVTATGADVIVAVLGEPDGFSGEAASRSEIGLPGRQQDLLKALLKTGKPIVLVLMNGRPLTLEWENQNIPAILEAWQGGTEAGNAVANALFGNYNPSGKLTMTFPRNVGQIPIYYNRKNTGRPYYPATPGEKYKSRYLDVSNDPLFPFGYGLSYTTFSYSNLTLDKTSFAAPGSLTITVAITNTGQVDGTEVAQLYIRDMVGSITRPLKELKGFRKIFLKAGESKTLTFTITIDDLAFYNAKLEHKAEPGDFKVFVGTSSADVKEASFTLK